MRGARWQFSAIHTWCTFSPVGVSIVPFQMRPAPRKPTPAGKKGVISVWCCACRTHLAPWERSTYLHVKCGHDSETTTEVQTLNVNIRQRSFGIFRKTSETARTPPWPNCPKRGHITAGPWGRAEMAWIDARVRLIGSLHMGTEQERYVHCTHTAGDGCGDATGVPGVPAVSEPVDA